MRLISSIDGERGYSSLLVREGDATAIHCGDGDAIVARGEIPAEEGRARLRTEEPGAEELVLSWSPAGPMLELTIGEARVIVHGAASSGTRGEERMSGPGIAWTLPEEGYSVLRTVWAITARSSLLMLASLRPEGAREHSEELVGAARIVPKLDPYGYAEPLLSTEYDPEGVHRRATLELWPVDEDPHPERAGGRRIAGGEADTPAGRLRAARFAWSIDGEAAVGGYEIISAE